MRVYFGRVADTLATRDDDGRGSLRYLHDEAGKIISYSRVATIPPSIFDQMQLTRDQFPPDIKITVPGFRHPETISSQLYLQRQYGIPHLSVVEYISEAPVAWGHFITDNARFHAAFPDHALWLSEQAINFGWQLPHYDAQAGLFFRMDEDRPGEKITVKQTLRLVA